MDNSQKSFDRNQYMPPAEKNDKQGASFSSAPKVGVSDDFAGGNGKKPMKGYLMIGGVVVLLVVIALFALARNPGMNSANQGGNNGNGTKVVPTVDTAKPALAFGGATEKHPIDETFTIQLKADSQGADVNGYDLLLPYDKSSLEIVSVKSLLPTFQIYQFDRTSYYSITGIKLLSAKGATVFNKEPILEFTLKGKKKGVYSVEIMPERGKEMSKFVDKDVKIIKPQFQPVIVEIQ
jgi:hypothetical protein